MEKNGKTKNIVLAVLLVAVVTLSIAYAVLSATLTINAQATVKGATWDVHFNEKANQAAICTAYSKDGAQSTTAEVGGTPSLTGTAFTGLNAILKLPGDKVVCTWQVTNAGAFDAKLVQFNKGTPTCTESTDCSKVLNKINYTLKVDNADPSTGDVLGKKVGDTATSKDVVLTVEFDPEATQLPSNDVTITGITAAFEYQQY